MLVLKFARAPGPPGDRGDLPLMATWADGGGMPPVVRSTPDAVPLVPVQLQSMELPATTVGEWRRHYFL